MVLNTPLIILLVIIEFSTMFLLFVRNTQKWNAMQTFVRKKNQQLQFHWKIIVRDNKDFLIRKHSFKTIFYPLIFTRAYEIFPEILHAYFMDNHLQIFLKMIMDNETQYAPLKCCKEVIRLNKYLQTKSLIKEQMRKHNLDQSFWNVV